MVWLDNFKLDRIWWMSVLVIASLVGVLLLRSQSAASYPSYLLTLLALVTVSHWKDVFKVSLFQWVLLLVLWLCASTGWSEPFSLSDATSIWIRALLLLAFVAAIGECQMRGQLQARIAIALAVVGSIVIGAALINFLISKPEDGRMNGLGQLDTHVIAALVYGVIGVFVLYVGLRSASRTKRLACFAVLILVIVAVYLSDSRNAWVAVPAGMLTFVLADRIQSRSAFVSTVAAAATLAALGFVILMLDPDIRSLMLPRGGSFRGDIWSAVLSRLDSSDWIIGRGILAEEGVQADGLFFDHAHNMYLSVLQKGGLVGLGLYLVVLIKAVYTLLSSYSERDAKLAIGILSLGISAHLLDGHELVDKVGASWFLIWLPIGIALGVEWRRQLSPE